MDPFTVIILGGVAVLVLALLLIGAYHPRSGADVLDWRPTRSPELEIELEQEDIDQMLAAQNERRRRDGRPELTEDGVRADVAADERLREELHGRDVAGE